MELKKDKQIKYLLKISDEVGVIEHATFDRPNYEEGWCVDDNARAIQVCLAFWENKGLKKKLSTYVKFIDSAWRQGRLFNDFNKDLSWKDDASTSGEHIGRALAAAGELIKKQPNFREIKKITGKIYNSIKNRDDLSPRVVAQLIFGCRYLFPDEITRWADRLIVIYNKTSNNSWKWFEPLVSYDNGRIPMALLMAFKIKKNKKYLNLGLETLDFLTDLLWEKDKKCFSFAGNNGWIRQDGYRAVFAQQPIEAGSMTEVYCLAYQITKNKKYKDLARAAFEWYQGRNISKLKMINEKSGGIYDGFEEKEINQNQGAEAVLSYLLAVKEIEKIKD